VDELTDARRGYWTHTFLMCVVAVAVHNSLHSKDMIQNWMHQRLRLNTYRIQLGHVVEYSDLPEAVRCAYFMLFYFMPS